MPWLLPPLACLLLLHRETLRWLIALPARDGLDLLALAALGTSLLLRPPEAAGPDAKPDPAEPPRLAAPALALAAAVALPLIVRRIADVDLIDAASLFIALWALAGLALPPGRWRRLLPPLLLLLAALPVGVWIDAFVGFPARALTADLVAALLAPLGVTLDHATILRADGAAAPALAYVDVPCSGVRSLRAGTLLLLAAAIARRLDTPRTPSAALAAAALLALTWILLLAANAARVLALVLAGPVAHLPDLADRLHTPLGLLGFAAAMAPPLWLISRAPLPATAETSPSAATAASAPTPPRALLRPAFALTAALCLALALDQRPTEQPEAVHFRWSPPATWQAAPIPLTPPERAFYAEVGVPLSGEDAPAKYAFTAPAPTHALSNSPTASISGSLILVPATRWRAHHLPEACQAPLGLSDSRLLPIGPDLLVRAATVAGGAQTLIWWFEAPDRRTHDLFSRAWADISGAQDRWVMVSLLLAGSPADLAPLLSDLARDLRAAFLPDPSPAPAPRLAPAPEPV